ncbi:hypothetical protein FS837_009662 [Tulasnella sp. UAMH 9824]|nr:hypothetical protein FS837_009662 [Tulasnella sp. UAMH 9824]
MPMGRTPGTKNQPGHRAGGRREGAGRKRKAALSDDETTPGLPRGPHDEDSSHAHDQHGQSGITSGDPPSPTIKLSSIHPDLIPFLGVPHNIPLVCFFDPNRYNPAAQVTPTVQQPQPSLSTLEVQDSCDPPPNGPTADPTNSTGAIEEDEDVEGNHASSSAQTVTLSESTGLESSETGQSSSTGPYVFHNPNLNPDPTHRRKRRCLICMNAGRVNHAFICPGRGNRAACATAREVAKHGGTLPAESSKWNSKNTHTPIFTPVPTPVFPLLPNSQLPNQGPSPVHPSPVHPSPLPLPPPGVQAAGTTALITALALPMQPPKPVAPLGYLTTGAIRKRRPRQCRICASRGEDGTTCVGRQAKQRCPYYSEALHGAQPESPGLAGVSSMVSDSDEEEQQVSSLVQQ